MSASPKHFYEFGRFRVDLNERSLFCGEQLVALTPKVFEALLVLVENSGRTVTKEDLMRRIWPDTFVDEGTLTRNISRLRQVLEGEPGLHKYIETVPKRGYRFVASVREVFDGDADVLLQRRIRSRNVAEEELVDPQHEVHSKDALKRDTESPIPLLKQRGFALTWQVLLPGLLIVVIAFLVYFLVSAKSKPSGGAAAVRSIAVLPFKILGTQDADENFGLGLADALITRLGSLKEITVRPTSAVQKFTADDRDPVAVGQELRVDAVLDGRVQRLGERIRVTVQLLSTRDGVPLWTQKVDREFPDIFAVQDSISNHVATALVLNMPADEKKQLEKQYTGNAQAYEAYLKGRYFWNKRTWPDFRRAIPYFQRAINLDKNYALAYAGLADCYSFIDEVANSKEAATKALAIDEMLAEAHASLGSIHLFHEWNWSAAERELSSAVELNPNYATAHHWYAYYFATIGQLDAALVEIKRARDIDPLSLIINTDLGQMLEFTRQYDQAIEQMRETIDMDPSFINAHFVMADAYLGEGLYQEAINEYEKINAISRTNLSAAGLSYAYALAGNKSRAIKELKALMQSPEPGLSKDYWLALIYSALGNKDEGFKWLMRIYEQKGPEVLYFKVDPKLDRLRSDQRYVELLQRVGLNPLTELVPPLRSSR